MNHMQHTSFTCSCVSLHNKYSYQLISRYFIYHVGGEDYVLRNPLVIIHPNTQRKEIYVHQIDDDIVEILTEEFYINIVLVTDRNGAPDKRVSIGRDKRTRLQIRDDDGM